MTTFLVRMALVPIAVGSLHAQDQPQRRLEVGVLLGTTQINARSRYPGESSGQPFIGVRTDARFMQLGPGVLGASLFWDRYRFDDIGYSGYCDPGPCTTLLASPPEETFKTGRINTAARLGGGLTWQLPVSAGLSANIGASAGRFARELGLGSGLSELADKATSRSFLGAEAGLTQYWRSLALGAGYEYNHAWRVRGSKPTAHRLLVRVGYTLPYN